MHARTTRTKPSPQERTGMIGDAAIEVLAAKGSRGLTHRAVDRHLEWPEGTTSRYYRTRDALMTAVVQRLVDFEIAHVAQWQEEAMVEGAMTREKVVEILTNAYLDWIAGGTRQIARYELSLEARRRPAVHDAIMAGRGTLHRIVQSALEAAGFPDPRAQATVFLASIDGMCHDRLLHLEFSVEPDHVKGILQRWLAVEEQAESGAYGS